MKLRIISLASLLLATGVALAANAPAAPHGGKDRMDRLALLLDLSEGQKGDVQRVLNEQLQQRKEQFQQAKAAGTRPSREEMRTQHEQMRKETIEKLRPVLSEQQLAKFQALTDHRQGPPPRRWHRDRSQPQTQPQQ
ncbi:MAG TPA: hypothetical protein VNQ81_06290 [Povalibacter sp.]|nr:hypothetical protein [Povalibacter sp.]